MILKRSKRIERYSKINDENKYKSKAHLFISKTTIMVNKREKYILYNFYFRQTAILFLYFFNFISFLLLFSSFIPIFFVLILSYLSGTCTFFFADISGRTFSPLLDISERNFFPRLGGGVHVHPVHPPAYAPAKAPSWIFMAAILDFRTLPKRCQNLFFRFKFVE